MDAPLPLIYSTCKRICFCFQVLLQLSQDHPNLLEWSAKNGSNAIAKVMTSHEKENILV